MAPKKKPKVVPVDWKNCDHFENAPTDQSTQFQIAKASIPLVFIPGIMGSRLERQNSHARVWDPNDSAFMWWEFHGVSGANRKKFLIDPDKKGNGLQVIATRNGSPTDGFVFKMMQMFSATFATEAGATTSYSPPSWPWLPFDPKLSDEEKVSKLGQLLTDQGWIEVAWDFYGDFLLTLANMTFHDFKWIFHHPVYAIGYNWVGDNKDAGSDLTTRILQIIDKEKSYKRECEKVIIISHSMGGLASRASMVPGVADKCSKSQVIGAVHGAQPATGAPAAYRRMRGGFEVTDANGMAARIKNSVVRGIMGPTSAEVVPILGNCPGGLELLPTKLYRYNGQIPWLREYDRDGKTIGEQLPKSGNPYNEIYRQDSGFLRLIYNPTLLQAGTHPTQDQSKFSKPGDKERSAFLGCLNKAETFHDKLADNVHDHTFVTYGVDKHLATFDHIDYKNNIFEMGGNAGKGADFEPFPADGSSAGYWTMSKQDGPGDGTVPVSSGGSLVGKSENQNLYSAKHASMPYKTTGHEHSDFYKDTVVHEFVRAAVEELSFIYRGMKIGK